MEDTCLDETELQGEVGQMTPKKHSSFVEINRDEEDKDVVLYQKTGNKDLFDKLYKNRIPTLQIWARQYYYLMDSKEDAFGEFSKYFAKAVKEYKKSKGTFNTCLFTFLINRIRNINVGRNAKKRKPQFLDPNDKNKNFLYSLEYSYKDGKNDGVSTLKDIIPDPHAKKDLVVHRMALEETLDNLSHGSSIIRGFLRKVSDGGTLSSIVKEYKTRTGDIKINHSLAQKLAKRKNKALAKKVIKKQINVDKFSVIDYYVVKSQRLYYTIELKKTKESALILSTIRKFRKNRPLFLSKITA